MIFLRKKLQNDLVSFHFDDTLNGHATNESIAVCPCVTGPIKPQNSEFNLMSEFFRHSSLRYVPKSPMLLGYTFFLIVLFFSSISLSGVVAFRSLFTPQNWKTHCHIYPVRVLNRLFCSKLKITPRRNLLIFKKRYKKILVYHILSLNAVQQFSRRFVCKINLENELFFATCYIGDTLAYEKLFFSIYKPINCL